MQRGQYARATSKVYGLAIPSSRFKAVLDQYPAIYQKLYLTTIDQLEEADYLRGLSALTGLEQTACGLHFLAARLNPAVRFNASPILMLSQAELAGLLGVSRETIVRACTQLRQTGTIHTTRGKITITDPEKLTAACGEMDS